MGLIAALRSAGYIMDRIEFVAENGSPRSALGGDTFRRTLGDRFLSIPRGDLANAIYRTIEHDVETIFGDSIVGIGHDADRAEVTFERGRSRSFDLVIGADGLHSAVRTAMFGPREQFERYLGYHAASFLTPDYPRRTEHTYLSYAAPGRQISRYSLRGGLTAFLLVFQTEARAGSLRTIWPRKSNSCGKLLHASHGLSGLRSRERLDACDELYFDAVSQIQLPFWSQGRSALVGDAAYCPSLLAGEGSAFAMGGRLYSCG